VSEDLRAALISLKVEFHLADRRLAALSARLPSNFVEFATDPAGRPLPQGEVRREFRLAEVPADLQEAIEVKQADLGVLTMEVGDSGHG
jgi:hypothetical protein